MPKQLFFILVAGVMAGCMHSGAATRARASTPPAESRPKASRRPEVEMVQLEMGPEKKAYRGWPLMVSVRMSAPTGWRIASPGPGSRYLRLHAESGALDSLLKVRLSEARPEEGSWPLTPEVLPGGVRVRELPSGERWLDWYLSAEETRGLAPGEYALSARLEPSRGPGLGATGGWVDAPHLFELVDEPSPLSAALRERKALAFARYEMQRGDPGAALAILDALLKEQPDSAGAWCFKAELAERARDFERALGLYEECLGAVVRREPQASDSSMWLMMRIDALRAGLGKRQWPAP